MLGTLAPEYDDLERSIMSLMRWRSPGRAVLKFLEPWVDKVVAADGRMHDMEFEALIDRAAPPTKWEKPSTRGR